MTTLGMRRQVELGGGEIPTATSRFDEAGCEHMTRTDVERAVGARAPGAEERRASRHGAPGVARGGAGVCTATLRVMTSQRAAAARRVGCTDVGSADIRSAGRLAVDRLLHAAEIARFQGHVACGRRHRTATSGLTQSGPMVGRFCLTRDGVGFFVRPHRYASAIAGSSVAAGVVGLCECDNPVCARIAAKTEA